MLWTRRASGLTKKGISLHFVEAQPIFHLSYGILVRKSKQRWELYSSKTDTISDMCTCMYTSIICGYKFYVLDLSLDNSSSSSTYNEIKRNHRTTRSGCWKLQLNSSPLISIPLCNVWAFPATSSVMSYDKPSSTFGTTAKAVFYHIIRLEN
jgi:hypothetical protein